MVFLFFLSSLLPCRKSIKPELFFPSSLPPIFPLFSSSTRASRSEIKRNKSVFPFPPLLPSLFFFYAVCVSNTFISATDFSFPPPSWATPPVMPAEIRHRCAWCGPLPPLPSLPFHLWQVPFGRRREYTGRILVFPFFSFFSRLGRVGKPRIDREAKAERTGFSFPFLLS